MAVEKISTTHWLTKAASIRAVGCTHQTFEKYDALGLFETQALPEPVMCSTKLYSRASVRRFAYFLRKHKRGAFEKYILGLLNSGLYYSLKIPKSAALSATPRAEQIRQRRSRQKVDEHQP